MTIRSYLIGTEALAVLLVSMSISALRTLDDTTGGAITVGGNWTNSGAFTAGTGSVTATSTATGTCALTSGGSGSAFYNLIIGAACAFTPQDNRWVLRHFVINAGGTYTNNARTLTLGGVGGVAGNLTDSIGSLQNLGSVKQYHLQIIYPP
jgi:fibronectin-binding autotransporter adhesin